jgi:hypothetical protein
MSSNKYISLEKIKMKMNNKDYLSNITKKKKMHEEIKDCVIDRFIKIMYNQNNEIFQLNKKLEDLMKKSLSIIKNKIIKKKLFPVNQINLSFIKKTKRINREKKGEGINLFIKNMLNIESNKDNNTINRNSAKSFANFNKLIIEKNKKIPSIDNKMNHNNNNNLLNYINNSQSYKKKSRILVKKNWTYMSDNKFSINKKNLAVPTNIYCKKKFQNYNLVNKSEEKGINAYEYKNNFFKQHSFYYDNNQNSIKSLTRQRKKNKIRIINHKLNNCKNINLSNNQNNIFDYCRTERADKSKEIMKFIFSLQKNNFNTINKKNVNKNLNNTYKNSFTYHKMNKPIKLNNFIMKGKELNKSLISTNDQKIGHKTENKSNIKDINNINYTNYSLKTDRLSFNQNAKKKIIYTFDEQGEENDINNNSSSKENKSQTIYNPTFTSFLNRK